MNIARFLTRWRGQRARRGLSAIALTASLFSGQTAWVAPAQAQQAQTGAYCQLLNDSILEKQRLLQSSLQGSEEAKTQYQNLLKQHAEVIRQCRTRTWPQNQAIWLRLYPCDAQPGVLEAVLDDIVNRGYNQVYVEVFANGQVLLPSSSNSTAWPSLLRTPGYENVDLLAQSIAKGRERGLKVYAWMFSLNFGYTYATRSDRQQVLAVNGRGETTVTLNNHEPDPVTGTADGSFVDPYHPQARYDYYQLLQAILQRKPDGVLFDYIRYPRGTGAASVAGKIQDLWVYGDAAQQGLYERAINNKGRALIQTFLQKGFVSAGDIAAVNKAYPQEGEPLWQGRTPTNVKNVTAAQLQPILQQELWLLSVAHAFQGVVDFLTMAVTPVQQQGIPAGAVFFPDGNKIIGKQGFDSRLQPWDRFPGNIEWHPMSYATCGSVDCIVEQVQRVLSQAPAGTQVKPVIAGNWGAAVSNRPSLEAQMQAIQRLAPQIKTVSHFAYSWQQPQFDRQRKFCKFQ